MSPRPNPRSCTCHVDLQPVRSHAPECRWFDPGLILCPACQGCGSFFAGRHVCQHCGGTGEVRRAETPHGCLAVALPRE